MVNGYRRVPDPPAKIIPFILFSFSQVHILLKIYPQINNFLYIAIRLIIPKRKNIQLDSFQSLSSFLFFLPLAIRSIPITPAVFPPGSTADHHSSILYLSLPSNPSLGSAALKHDSDGLEQNLNIHSDIPVLDIFHIKFYNFLKVSDITSSAHLPHSGQSRFHGKSSAVIWLILFPLIYCWWTSSYETHISSLCQLRNNFFSKISHKAQYYQLTLKISTKKEPLISQKSQTLRFYLYSISPNCTILA